MGREDVTRRFYSKLTVLPSTRVLVLVLSFSIIVVGILVSLSTGNFVFFLAYTMSGLVYVLVLELLLASKLPFNPRRVLGLATYTLTIGLIIDLIAIPSGVHGLVFTSSGGIAYVALTGLMTAGVKAIAYVVTSSFLSYAIFALVTGASIDSIIANILAFTIGLTSYALYLRLINKRGEHWGIQPLKLARAFLMNWLSNITEPMENILSSLSKPRDAKIHILVFEKSNAKPITLVLPEIHYGPFRNVGSSTMIYMIEEALSTKGYNVLALHGPGSHEHNLPTAKYSQQIADRIADEFSKVKPIALTPRRPFRVESNGWEALVIPFDKAVLVFTTRQEGIDDLPSSILKVVEEKSRDAGIEMLLVDSHNSYTREDFNGENVVSLIDTIIERVLQERECKLRVGYGEVYIDEIGMHGLCNGRVRSIVFECNGRRVGVTYLYGNNMFPDTRIKLKELVLGSKLLDDYEPITPDDHTCTATLAEHPYVPVRYSEKLGRAVLESIHRALRDLDEAKAYYYGLTISNVRYVGEGIFDMLGLLEEVGGFVEKTINIVFVSTMLVQLLAVYLTAYFI